MRSVPHGFSLVETLVAAVVLIVGLAGVAQLLALSVTMQRRAREAMAATALAESKVAELRSQLRIAPLPPATPPAVDSLAHDVAGCFDRPEAGVTRRWRISAGPAAGTRTVTVRVVDERVPGAPGVELTTIAGAW